MTDTLNLHVQLRNAEHRNRRLQERLDAAHEHARLRAAILAELRRAANVATEAELLEHVRNTSIRGVIVHLPPAAAELATAQAAHRGAEAEVEALREWRELHSADVRSIRAELEEVEEQRDDAYTKLSALRQALSAMWSLIGVHRLPVDECVEGRPTAYRPDTGIDEAICAHGIGHPIRPEERCR